MTDYRKALARLREVEQERDKLQAWYEKVAPMTVPTAREALAEKRAKAAEVRLREYEEALTEIESKPYRAEEVIARLRASA